jgi:hypothetical protein
MRPYAIEIRVERATCPQVRRANASPNGSTFQAGTLGQFKGIQSNSKEFKGI